MPLRGTPICLKCRATESPLWTNAENLGAICLNCVNESKESIKTAVAGPSVSDIKPPKHKQRATRSTRLNPFALPRFCGPKGRGRRSIFKKSPSKAPDAIATPVTSSSVFSLGTYYQIGDLVSIIGDDDNIYYAQIRGLLTDQYCEKSAVITWLLPTRESPPPNEGFDPATYIIGPEEDTPRSLRCMNFLMHAPSDYYKSVNTPYPNISAPALPGYVWTSLRPLEQPIEVIEID
ncbi:hypothetical protein WA026_004692 [Henosepilachna vigintioctopunctata]|uniref:GATA zinc finger domain-containing protein 1 n=1 Tax=Henosepilachna vigintioctopunctata TaxID=420089 RepID=A0AAW1V8E8_9CUCU